MTNKDRILTISKELGLSHIGSNLSCLPILEEIYAKKKPEDIVILDNAHAHLAHLVVKHPYNEKDYLKTDDPPSYWVGFNIYANGIHCDRKAGCDASGGSLGHGLGIAIGYALADRKRDVYCIVSDGSMMEGSGWEALRIANELLLSNIHIYTNFNGYSAVAKVNSRDLQTRMECQAWQLDINFIYTDNGEGFEGVEGHYKKL